jgi:hypothetical protein
VRLVDEAEARPLPLQAWLERFSISWNQGIPESGRS